MDPNGSDWKVFDKLQLLQDKLLVWVGLCTAQRNPMRFEMRCKEATWTAYSTRTSHGGLIIALLGLENVPQLRGPECLQQSRIPNGLRIRRYQKF